MSPAGLCYVLHVTILVTTIVTCYQLVGYGIWMWLHLQAHVCDFQNMPPSQIMT